MPSPHPSAGLDLLIELGPPGPRGARRRSVEEALRTAIREGRLAPGVRLPATRDLAEQLGLARGTVTQAYEQLIAEGWLTARTKAGTRVAAGGAAQAVRATDPPPSPPPPAAPTEPRHDLSPGRPDLSSFPRAAWSRALRRAIHEAPAEAFGYGDPRGRIELRTALAAYLGRVRGVRVAPEQLLICSGFTQALGLLAEVLAGTGVRALAIENPAMPEHVAIAAARLAVRDVTVDDQGLRVGELADGDARAVVCTPAHQFPLGVSMSPARRAALLAWAEECDGWIVEDDYDGEFRYDRRPVGALQARRPDRVVYAGSVSKALGPAVRLGWIACPPRLLEPLVTAKYLADRQTPVMEQLALAELLDSGAYDHHLRTMRRGYRRRRDTLVRAVAEQLPPGARLSGIAAGLHAIVRLPADRGLDEQRIGAALRQGSVRARLLGEYLRGAAGAEAPPALVVGYATPSAHAYAGAVDALLGVLRGLG
ncbi:MocR-like pyridoxine biosynthesis transcription factor PdxR [Kitasatospora sp. NBC_01266]|uniref:MocR-like pyridoxine biosynthesis transcription factor PdxR n=1 Tax=Kitasatospora sp. NBC_01266 TaxID=2903572 RepID=UPI002E3196D7|nr:PLP-dependent aminotransferase family protein [Kitasatospora sp. NBC_01266]